MWLGNTGIWTFWWIGCWSFDLLSGFMEGYVILKFYFEDFFLGFLGYGKLCCKQDDHHRNLHILSHFHNLDPHDLAVRILHIFVLFLQNILLWPYFWQLKHRWGLGIYTYIYIHVFRMRKPTFIYLGISWPFIVKIYESAGINLQSLCLFILSTFVTSCDCNSSWMSSSFMPASSLHQITHLE